MPKKKPKPPYNTRLITVEDASRAGTDRGWRIAAGKTARLVDIHASPPPPDAGEAIFASNGRQLPCTFHRRADGSLDHFHESSYEI